MLIMYLVPYMNTIKNRFAREETLFLKNPIIVLCIPELMVETLVSQ